MSPARCGACCAAANAPRWPPSTRWSLSTGLAHTLLTTRSIAPDDLRRLPDEKFLETTQWRGLVAEEPASQYTPHASRRALDRTTFVFRVEAWRVTGGRLFGADITDGDEPWQPATGDLRCTLLGPAQDLRLGNRLEFAAALEPIAPAPVPGEFNSREVASRQGITYELTILPSNWRRVSTGGGDWLQRLSYAARDWAYGRLQLGLEDDPRTADFLAGMLIGYRQQIPEDIEQDFRRTGTIHVFAVSGQNIAEMLVVALVLLQLAGLVRWRWAWIVAPLVLLYCLLTGSPASAVRATVMALAVLLAWRIGRPLNALACWSLAFLALTIWNPQILLDPGAQLSFALVLALILIAPPLTRLFMKPLRPIRSSRARCSPLHSASSSTSGNWPCSPSPVASPLSSSASRSPRSISIRSRPSRSWPTSSSCRWPV